jgi:hypothetical protein
MRRLWSTYSRTIGISLAAVVLTLFGLAAPAAAGDQVPVTATATGVVTGTTHLPGGITQVDESLTGNATYLRNFTATGTGLLNSQANYTYTRCMVGSNGTDSVCIAISVEPGQSLLSRR